MTRVHITNIHMDYDDRCQIRMTVEMLMDAESLQSCVGGIGDVAPRIAHAMGLVFSPDPTYQAMVQAKIQGPGGEA
jgi:hypothetical protein